jgi:hypothetical protein
LFTEDAFSTNSLISNKTNWDFFIFTNFCLQFVIIIWSTQNNIFSERMF